MRFVWAYPQQEEKPAAGAAEELEIHKYAPEHEKDLYAYFEAQKYAKLKPKEKLEFDEFKNNLDLWDEQGNVEAMRIAGRSMNQDLENYLAKHAMLSSAFLERVSGTKVRFNVNFLGNQTAYWKVGAGDILPPNVTKIKVYKANGETAEGTRGFHPRTRRIGYFDSRGNYIPVFTGDEIEIMETVPIPKQGNRKTLSEHIEIYQRGAAHDTASVGAELLYDAPSRTVFPNVEAAKNYHKDRIQQETKDLTEGVRGEILHPKAKNNLEVAGKKYPRFNRTEWRELCGQNANAVERWIIRRDPLTGGPVEFFGDRIGGGINMAIYPYLKEAESRIKNAGISYKFNNPSCFNWRPIRGGNVLSYHSWAVAVDINPGTNQMGTQGDMPMEVVKIFESLGFTWGGHWKGKRRDPMHFQFNIDPFAGKELLTGTGLDYWKAMEPQMNARRPRRTAAPGGSPSYPEIRQIKRSPYVQPVEGIETTKTKNIQKIAEDHDRNSEKMELLDAYKSQLEQFRNTAINNKRRYEAVAERTGIPWKLIAALHYREASMQFDRILHNGTPLGQKSKAVPRNIPVFYDWESSAIHALNMKKGIQNRLGINYGTKDIGPLLAFAESYNGLGYRNRNRTSPYVYAGTNIYQGGMYRYDGKYFEAGTYVKQRGRSVDIGVDKRPGVAACILALQGA